MHRFIADCCLEEGDDVEGTGEEYRNDLGLRDRGDYDGADENQRLSKISEESD